MRTWHDDVGVLGADLDVLNLYELKSLGSANRETPSTADARRLLDVELETVGLRALVAIARGWKRLRDNAVDREKGHAISIVEPS